MSDTSPIKGLTVRLPSDKNRVKCCEIDHARNPPAEEDGENMVPEKHDGESAPGESKFGHPYSSFYPKRDTSKSATPKIWDIQFIQSYVSGLVVLDRTGTVPGSRHRSGFSHASSRTSAPPPSPARLQSPLANLGVNIAPNGSPALSDTSTLRADPSVPPSSPAPATCNVVSPISPEHTHAYTCQTPNVAYRAVFFQKISCNPAAAKGTLSEFGL
ncbi:hypothetical protein BDV93DRAFT_513348 [Ceratobasidium sp. AG-I]|nr:hypothetical protein BDV93DRAFT_513348 [Ceratobasidium sp. AG-I]